MTLKEELHGTIRLQIHLAKAEGLKIDKKLMRYDSLVDLALQYGSLGDVFNGEIPRDVVRSEIVGVCVVDSTDYTGAMPDFKWMCSSRYEE